MYRVIAKTKGMPREEWLRLRRCGIGGSDAGAVCGVNPYSSPMKVFRDKTGGETEEVNSEAVRTGHDLEQYVAERFMEASGLKVRRANVMYASVEHPFMIADVDRLVTGMDAGLECKTVSAYGADQWADGNVPPHYALQCYHYMAVTGRKTWYIAALIMGREFVYRKLIWDDRLVWQLVETEERFWNDHVMKGVMPEPDGSGDCDRVISQYYCRAGEGSSVELSGFDGKLDRREEILAEIKELEREQKQIEQEVKLYMKEAESASSGHYRVSWKNVDTTRLDTARIRKEQPGIYQDYSKVTTSRRLQIRAA